jgi:uncharacterized protein YndB with AHSA1/START domain
MSLTITKENLAIEHSVTLNTFVIERNYPAAPAWVFAAFADPAKKRRWFVEGDHHAVESYEMDFRVGGREQASMRLHENTPLKGAAWTNETIYQDIVTDRRIVFASRMTIAERCISAALGTVESQASGGGTKMIFTHQAAFFEGADGPEMREAGWHTLLAKLEVELADRR